MSHYSIFFLPQADTLHIYIYIALFDTRSNYSSLLLAATSLLAVILFTFCRRLIKNFTTDFLLINIGIWLEGKVRNWNCGSETCSLDWHLQWYSSRLRLYYSYRGYRHNMADNGCPSIWWHVIPTDRGNYYERFSHFCSIFQRKNISYMNETLPIKHRDSVLNFVSYWLSLLLTTVYGVNKRDTT